MTLARMTLGASAAVAALVAAPASAQYSNQGYGYQYPNGSYGQYNYNQQYPNAYGQYPSNNGYAYGRYRYTGQNGYNPYNRYPTNPYGYQGRMTAAKSQASQQCTASVQNKLQTRRGLPSVIASLVGAGSSARVLNVTGIRKIKDDKNQMRVTGLASSGSYGAYGVGAYGAAAYSQRPDLSFTCDVDRYGRVQNVDINRL